MNQVERFFLQRYVQEPKRNLLRFSFVFMVLGIVLSVGILTAALNLFEGYERALKSALLDSFPHISIQAVYSQFLDPQDCETARQALAERQEIASLTPKLTFNLMAYNGSKVRGGLVNAYAWKQGERVNYAKYVKKGKALAGQGEVVVGSYLARELGLALGDTLHLVYPRMDQISPLGLYPNVRPMKITGIYDSGFYEYDRSLIICNLNDAREIISLPVGFSNLEIKLKPEYLDGVEDLAYDYGKLLGRDMSATGVANTQLLRIVRMQKWLIFIVFSFLLLIAGINVISAVSTLIYDKKNEIAVLKTLGASSGTIKRLLYYQVAFVCLASILIGQLFGYILSWLVVHQRFYQLKGEVYFINRLELYVSPLNQLVIFLVAAVVAILCIRIPLRRIDRMFIIDLLRNP